MHTVGYNAHSKSFTFTFYLIPNCLHHNISYQEKEVKSKQRNIEKVLIYEVDNRIHLFLTNQGGYNEKLTE